MNAGRAEGRGNNTWQKMLRALLRATKLASPRALSSFTRNPSHELQRRNLGVAHLQLRLGLLQPLVGGGEQLLEPLRLGALRVLVGAADKRLQKAEAELQVRDAEIAALKLVAGIPSK